jgi:PAS domain S-box-containing protein
MATSSGITSGHGSDSVSLQDLAGGMRTLLDLVDGYAYLKDSAGRYIFANKKVQELFGRSYEDILGKDDAAFFDLSLANQLRIHDRLVIDQGETIDREEENIIKATGEKRIYWTVKKPIRNQQGQIIGMCGISTDITASKRI